MWLSITFYEGNKTVLLPQTLPQRCNEVITRSLILIPITNLQFLSRPPLSQHPTACARVVQLILYTAAIAEVNTGQQPLARHRRAYRKFQTQQHLLTSLPQPTHHLPPLKRWSHKMGSCGAVSNKTALQSLRHRRCHTSQSPHCSTDTR